jgi:hypothetical protein
MTRNLYVGTDVDAVIAALRTDPADDLPTIPCRSRAQADYGS